MFRSFVKWMRREPERKKILCSDEGFEVSDSKQTYGSITWKAVSRINAFKRDLFTFDLICFEFIPDEASNRIEVDEEMEAFDSLVHTLPVHFAGFDTEWWSKVVKPAFAPNFTEVWRRR